MQVPPFPPNVSLRERETGDRGLLVHVRSTRERPLSSSGTHGGVLDTNAAHEIRVGHTASQPAHGLEGVA